MSDVIHINEIREPEISNSNSCCMFCTKGAESQTMLFRIVGKYAGIELCNACFSSLKNQMDCQEVGIKNG